MGRAVIKLHSWGPAGAGCVRPQQQRQQLGRLRRGEGRARQWGTTTAAAATAAAATSWLSGH